MLSFKVEVWCLGIVVLVFGVEVGVKLVGKKKESVLGVGILVGIIGVGKEGGSGVWELFVGVVEGWRRGSFEGL